MNTQDYKKHKLKSTGTVITTSYKDNWNKLRPRELGPHGRIPYTITVMVSFDEDFAQCRGTWGWSVSEEQFRLGGWSVGMPLRNFLD